MVSWLPVFLGRYMATLSPPDWPREGEEVEHYFSAWEMAVEHHAVAEEEAEAALAGLVMAPPRFRSEHIPAFIAQVNAVRNARKECDPLRMSRDECRRQSRGCGECGGEGQTFRRFEGADGELYHLGFECLCPAGRWLTAHRRSAPPSEGARSLSLADYPSLWDRQCRHPSWPAPPKREPLLPSVERGGEPVSMKRALRFGERLEPRSRPEGRPRGRDAIREVSDVPIGPDVTFGPDGRAVAR